MNDINTDDPINLVDGTTHFFVGRSGSVVRLKNAATNEYTDMHLAELSSKCVGLPRTFSGRIRDFESLDKKKQKSTIQMADHIEEILSGINPSREGSLPEYDPSTTTQNQRITAKIAELAKTGQSTSRATLHRRMKSYREEGATGLADQRWYRTDGPLDNLHVDVFEALCDVIGDQKNRSSGTKLRLIDETRVLLLKRHGENAPAMPSQASMYRYIDVLTKNKHTTGSAMTRRSLANRPAAPFNTRTELLPGNEVQVDSTTMDVFVRDSRGKAVRPILTVMIDRETRLVLAFTLRFDGTKAIDHVTLLAQALTPPQNRPDKSAFRQLVQRMNPHVKLLSHEERTFLEATRPYVHPRRIVMDNGRDYISKAFEAALQLHGIDISYSAPHTPTTKAIVERNFGSISTLFTQHLKGYTGRSPERKGYKVENEGIMDIYALHEVLEDWLLKVYNHRPHGGLRDVMEPSIKHSPYTKFTAASRLTSNLERTLTRDEYIKMLPTVYRHVSDTGVVYNHRQFDSVELNPLRHVPSNVPRENGRHEVKLDPYNPMFAWVKNPAGGWIECTVRNFDANLIPHLEDRDFDISDDADDRTDVATVTAAVTGSPLHTIVIQKPVETQLTDSTPDDTDDDSVFALS